jgi:Asp-tRNA(Asn)/Glu-tRNA(Gln) amidotransferase A subunit family amidase
LVTALSAPPEAGYFATRTVAELGDALRRRTMSSGELVERSLREADRLGPALNAFVTVDEEGARAAARRADQELAEGLDRGPLHGIPVAVKDLLDTAGLRTTMGSRHFADHVPGHDAAVVRRLRTAGAVIVGKTTTHEFAYGPTGDRSATGAARNPYRPDHMAGGSSGGSAAAVAAGIVPLSVGTDTGGSVRIPAACCGVVGLRPTWGGLPVDGVFPLSQSLDTVGVMARTAEDCRLMWTALAGPDATDPGRRPARSLQVGWVPPETFHPTDPRVARTARAALERSPGLGRDVREVVIPGVADLLAAYRAIQGREAHAVHAERLATAPELYGDEVRARLRGAAQIDSVEYEEALRTRDRVRTAIAALLRRQDVLALPTIPIPVPPLNVRRRRLAGAAIEVRPALLSLTSPWSVVGLPALSVPAGLVDGLPTGLQLVAAAGREDLLMTAARWLQQADGTHPDDTDTARRP